MAGIVSARADVSVSLLVRTAYIVVLPANGLGATDIETRGAIGGLFLEFVGRVRSHYLEKYGAGSPQLADCSDGYHFEPSVAEGVFEKMLAEQARIAVRRQRQFDALPGNVTKKGTRLIGIRATDRRSGAVEDYAAKVFIDATYEGDLAAAAVSPFRGVRGSGAETSEALS